MSRGVEQELWNSSVLLSTLVTVIGLLVSMSSLLTALLGDRLRELMETVRVMIGTVGAMSDLMQAVTVKKAIEGRSAESKETDQEPSSGKIRRHCRT